MRSRLNNDVRSVDKIRIYVFDVRRARFRLDVVVKIKRFFRFFRETKSDDDAIYPRDARRLVRPLKRSMRKIDFYAVSLKKQFP